MAKKSEIKLIGTVASPFVNRVQFVLNLKSIEYEYIEENLACKSELLLTSNPVHKKVPVLIHANKPPICESLIIIEYLDEIKPDVHRILPSDPLERADNRFWANYIDNKFFPLYEEMRVTPGKEGKDAIKKRIIEGSVLLEEAFIKFSRGKTYFGGDDVGYLDVVLGCFIAWTKFTEKNNEFKVFDEVRTPRLVEWVKRIWSHEAVKDVIPGNEVLVNFYMMLQKYRPPRAV
ncbi:glutathione S-transferase U17-like [Cynara cardunculus var. scolymus]|uniref:Glutathione S-transferase n=1 Tax=Cynara cardunculus var. scolymus TaxID=59895 RepID=A0A118FTE0_CYNCS|nr:glutathione S-transferase U17-like [Cynara cardunculus var. scolymus]KVF53980.1 Glutathione S-transferase/chloride channel, C-terminal [Cynara cardunculus var. scolymus]